MSIQSCSCACHVQVPAAPKLQPDKMAVGGQGGFQVDREWDVEKEAALVVLPSQQRIPLPCPELPELVLNAITAVQARMHASSILHLSIVGQPSLRVHKYHGVWAHTCRCMHMHADTRTLAHSHMHKTCMSGSQLNGKKCKHLHCHLCCISAWLSPPFCILPLACGAPSSGRHAGA